jgi:methionyl-tRNA formyltransferase
VPTLARLVAGPHAVVAVVTQPDRPRGRGQKVSPSPVAECAARSRIPVLRPERVGEPAFADTLRSFDADFGIVVAFGQFLPKRIRELPRRGYLINAHASILPRHRGAAPIARAILAGDAEAGVSVMRVEREMDAGPSAVVHRTKVGADETTGELTERLAAIAADAIAEAVDLVATDRIVWTPQDDARATLAPKLGPGDARLDFRDAAVALARRVRAMAPRPGAFTTLAGERLRVLAARALDEPCADEPGTLRIGGAAPLRVATGAGWLAPRIVQRAGGKPLDVEVFLRGNPLADGARLDA